MTAPDPTPYLLPTDLRTAEDVARWLLEHAAEWRAYARAHPEAGAVMVRIDYGGAATLDGASEDLRARLDRERRQACRRGALDAWREFRRWVHGWGYGWGDGDGIALDVLARALAFRAAARQP